MTSVSITKCSAVKYFLNVFMGLALPSHLMFSEDVAQEGGHAIFSGRSGSQAQLPE